MIKCKPTEQDTNYFTKKLENYEKYTGRQVINKYSRRIGVILRICDSGSIQVLENVNPYVLCTHDNWNTLELIEE